VTLDQPEIAVLRMSAGGMTRGEIAFALDIAEPELEQIVANIFLKLDVSDIEAAICAAEVSGFLETNL
jgi:DNA-binding NarL/FixJ family response regulator